MRVASLDVSLQRLANVCPSGPLFVSFIDGLLLDRSGIRRLADNAARGRGIGTEGSHLMLPSDTMEDDSYLEYEGMPRWEVEIYFELFDGGAGEQRWMGLGQFVYAASHVFVHYGAHVEPSWDPWPQIAAMRASCTVEAQSAMIPSWVKDAIGRHRFPDGSCVA